MTKAGALLKQERYPHKYPYDWRTKKPTIFRATEQVCLLYRLRRCSHSLHELSLLSQRDTAALATGQLHGAPAGKPCKRGK